MKRHKSDSPPHGSNTPEATGIDLNPDHPVDICFVGSPGDWSRVFLRLISFGYLRNTVLRDSPSTTRMPWPPMGGQHAAASARAASAPGVTPGFARTGVQWERARARSCPIPPR